MTTLGVYLVPAVRPTRKPYAASHEAIEADGMKRVHRRVVGKSQPGVQALLRGLAS